MKNVMKGMLVAVIAAALVFGVVACGGGGDPKSLAKQSIELTKDALGLIGEGIMSDDHPKAVALKKKADALEKKIEKLSEANKKIYESEFSRLLKE
jgi:hypothetical protein